ncbi:23S rRNA (uracil(1939)-C(5))-methyltransferase RlmD [Candidatus Woesearchaeota archaeon CG08_land_8_20_14_0_20_47_9]|nr:MAG: 23S rRNA (uracil-5-)-methyltransferase RumA [Candidatus Woesearchaeota archaeon CG1_02_47_18]PIO03250.1 MAG: 23S rRNA (uracil(1939)-C(5))-methyltransferase RlmD [Candidatus Woesearchaeota archaeon CG08_land_8_20_14_0_20_47_9]HII30247.1 23S rRNA (uracil(1939)-C(5))-methyltransferase RlmD [Candidatus Woesearchaeota archaeon]
MTKPLCPYFDRCGGCTLQKLPYEAQIEGKKKRFASAISFDSIKVFSGSTYSYRNRMDMLFHPGGLGLRQRGRWQNIIDVERCAIADDGINSLIGEIRGFFTGVDAFDIKRHTGTFRYAVIRTANRDSSVSFVLNDSSARLADAIAQIKEFAEKASANNIIVTRVPPDSDLSVYDDYFVVKGKDMISEVYLGRRLWYNVQGFFQNNHGMAERMHEYCQGVLQGYETRQACLLDLYGGVGCFGIINANLFKNVTIVEEFKQAVDAANMNIRENMAGNVKAVQLDARQLRRLTLPGQLFVITDPPRSGMDPKAIQQLNALKPEAIIYVSCNIRQLAKDIPKFRGYRIRSAALFDFFPQTPHSEAVVELVGPEQ